MRFFEEIEKMCNISVSRDPQGSISGTKKQAKIDKVATLAESLKKMADESPPDEGFGSEMTQQNPASEHSPADMAPGMGVYEEPEPTDSPKLGNRIFNKGHIEEVAGIDLQSFVKEAHSKGLGEMDDILGVFFIYADKDLDFDNFVQEWIEQGLTPPSEDGQEVAQPDIKSTDLATADVALAASLKPMAKDSVGAKLYDAPEGLVDEGAVGKYVVVIGNEIFTIHESGTLGNITHATPSLIEHLKIKMTPEYERNIEDAPDFVVDIIERLIDQEEFGAKPNQKDMDNNIRMRVKPKASLDKQAALTWQVSENNGGGLTLYVWDGDKLIYGHAGYEYNPGQLSEDIGALKKGDNTSDWEGNDITDEDIVKTYRTKSDDHGQETIDKDDVFDKNGKVIPLTSEEYYDDHESTKIIADESGVVEEENMGAAGRKEFYPSKKASLDKQADGSTEKLPELVDKSKENKSEVYQYFLDFFRGKSADELAHYYQQYKKERSGSKDEVAALQKIRSYYARGCNMARPDDISSSLAERFSCLSTWQDMMNLQENPQVIINNVMFEHKDAVWHASRNFDHNKFKADLTYRVRILDTLNKTGNMFYGQKEVQIRADDKLYMLNLLGAITGEAVFEKPLHSMSDAELHIAKQKVLASPLDQKALNTIKAIDDELLNRRKNVSRDKSVYPQPHTEVVDVVEEDSGDGVDYSATGNRSTEQPDVMTGMTVEKSDGNA